MEKFKKTNVVMLPTTKESILCLSTFIGLSLTTQMLSIVPDFVNQHLYIISDDDIKEGDWVYKNDSNPKVFKWINTTNTNFNYKKIIATTDTSLNLAQPSQEFIEKYIESYNEFSVEPNNSL